MNPEDILIWPDDVWCYASEQDEMTSWRSDDYRRIPEGTEEWITLVEDAEF